MKSGDARHRGTLRTDDHDRRQPMPHFVNPRLFVCLWLLIGLLLVAAGIPLFKAPVAGRLIGG